MKYVNWILVPIDFSEDSRLALEAADCQAERWDSGLILLHVVKPVETPRTRMSIEEGALERWTRKVQRTPQDRVAHMTCHGDPVKVILRIAAQYQPRKIIMGRGGDARRAGSVAEAVGREFPGIVEAVSAKREDVFVHARGAS